MKKTFQNFYVGFIFSQDVEKENVPRAQKHSGKDRL